MSMPCMEAFERQSQEYKNSVLPEHCRARFAIEAGVSSPWYKYIELGGKIISVENFGFSGQPSDLLSHFRLTGKDLENLISTNIVG